jgi:glucokinase
MEQFYRFLASVAADLAMTTGAYGGIYIAGGIAPEPSHTPDRARRT